MIYDNNVSQETKRLARPLCCRYLLLHGEALSVTVLEDGEPRTLTVRWGLGVLDDGQREALGAWPEPESGVTASRELFEDLQARGVEKVRFIVGNEREAMPAEQSMGYCGATFLPAPGQLLRQSLAQVLPRHRILGREALCAVRDAATAHTARAAMAELAASPLAVTYPAVVDRWREAVTDLEPFYALGPRLRRLILAADATAERVAETLQRAVARKGSFQSEAAAVAFVSDVLERADRGFRSAGPVARLSSRANLRGLGEGAALAGRH